MLEELSKTVKAQLYERVSSPLLGSFLIAWCGWNYKFVLVLISSMEAEKKLAYINANLYPSIWDKVLEGFTYPLVTSLVLIFAYPWPARWIFSYSRKQQLRLKKLQYEIDEDTPLNMEDARELRRSNSKIVEDFEKEISLQKSQIERQKEQLSVATESLKEIGDDKAHVAQLLEQLAEHQRRNERLNERVNYCEKKLSLVRSTLKKAQYERDNYNGRYPEYLSEIDKALAMQGNSESIINKNGVIVRE
ncbi:hypothetical protein [Pseudomonas sp. Marseille-Q7302]